ncbi:MAG TPA: hypothetical protein VLJ58_15370 [Ramlibacter sp.]|nr:hypothetical protein [Ramlibacter sp.]
MAFTVTSPQRRVVMAVLLALAVSGGIVRTLAPNPSTLRDIGTLLLVLWVPAIGNLIGYLKNKIPRSEPPPTDFAPGTAFAPQLQAQIEANQLPRGFLETMDPADRRATVIVGRRGFTVRLEQPVAQWLAHAGQQGPQEQQAFELLRPDTARPHLPAGCEFHLLVGTTAVAKGRVVGLG